MLFIIFFKDSLNFVRDFFIYCIKKAFGQKEPWCLDLLTIKTIMILWYSYPLSIHKKKLWLSREITIICF